MGNIDQHDAAVFRPDRVLALRRRVQVIAREQMIPAQLEVAFENEEIFAAGMIVRGISCSRFKFQQDGGRSARFLIKPQDLYENTSGVRLK